MSALKGGEKKKKKWAPAGSPGEQHKSVCAVAGLNLMRAVAWLKFTVPPWSHPSKSCQINALHPSSVHMALKACSATQITALLNYNFVRSGSVLYRRHSEISPKDRAVSPDASITWRAMWNRQLISRGLLRRSSSKPGAGQEVPSKQSEVCSPLFGNYLMWVLKWKFIVIPTLSVWFSNQLPIQVWVPFFWSCNFVCGLICCFRFDVK